jgi:hypothetical protein
MLDSIRLNAETQNLYRIVNERIAEVYNGFADSVGDDDLSGLFELFCECGQADRCRQRVKVDSTTYERVRSDPTTFVLFPGHQTTEVENTIGIGNDYLITRNIGLAAEIARAGDPRRGNLVPSQIRREGS